MIRLLHSTFSSFKEFQRETKIISFWKPLGIFLKVFGIAVRVFDEQGKVHYVSSKQLKSWGVLHHIPSLKGEILITQIKRIPKENDFVWPDDLSEEYRNQLYTLILHSNKNRQEFYFLPLQQELIYSVLNVPGQGIYLVKQGEKNRVEIAFDLLQGRICNKFQVDALLKIGQVKWPDAIEEELKMTIFEKKTLEMFLKRESRAWGISNKSSRIKIRRVLGGLPCSIVMIPSKMGYLKRVFLLLNSQKKGLVGEGGQRKIKFAYDLIKGEMAIKKPLSANEVKPVRALKGIRGFPKCLGFYESLNKMGGKCFNVFEPLYLGSLRDLLKKKGSLSPQEKYQICKDLLESLAKLHQLKCADEGDSYHSDIKTSNMLYRRTKDSKLDIAITDLGFANYFEHLAGTLTWFSPEYAKSWLERNSMPKDARRVFNQQYGQKLDLWGMGLTIATILKNDGSSRLACLNFKGKDKEILKGIMAITQESIDQEIDAFLIQEQDPKLKSMWGIAKAMLRKNPTERMSAEKAYQSI